MGSALEVPWRDEQQTLHMLNSDSCMHPVASVRLISRKCEEGKRALCIVHENA
jgi:hypothetical protein